MTLILSIVAGVVAMEFISYALHRWLFHGLLWRIHKTHHKPHHGWFELNDIFSLGFAAVSTGLIIKGAGSLWHTPEFGVGIGIALYGLLYFIIHDVFTHKRFVSMKSDNAFIRLVRRAHQKHHQDVGKKGQEPYGLFLFPYDKYPERKRKNVQ